MWFVDLFVCAFVSFCFRLSRTVSFAVFPVADVLLAVGVGVGAMSVEQASVVEPPGVSTNDCKACGNEQFAYVKKDTCALREGGGGGGGGGGECARERSSSLTYVRVSCCVHEGTVAIRGVCNA